jgi:hypothetical protein
MTKERNTHFGLRRAIMERLYELFRQVPYASIELRQLAEDCSSEAEELNWNLVYLEKKGYIELSKSVDCPPYVACSVTLSADGIDLIEDRDRFENAFPA